MRKKTTVFDLFSGCGGMSWGLHKAWFEILWWLDNWAIALETFKLNHPNAKTFYWDIRDFSPEKVRLEIWLGKWELDCLVGWPPCQGFSKNVPSSGRFLEDPRNQLFKEYLNFVEEFLPKVVVMENVAEIYNAFDGSVRNQIVERLVQLGYKVEVGKLFAPDYGVPQRRSRCFFIWSRTGNDIKFPLPTHVEPKNNSNTETPTYISAWDAISDLPELENGGGELEMSYDKPPMNDYQKFMRGSSQILEDHKTRELKGIQLERIKSIKAGQWIKDLPEKIRPKGGYSGAYGRLDFANVSPTITRWVFHPGSWRYGHPKNERLITMREAARLQSFTDDFRFCGTYIEKAHQIGNAVPSLFMYNLAKSILKALKEDHGANP